MDGSPGPVWLDVPVDVQSAQIDPDGLPGFTPPPSAAATAGDTLAATVRDVVERLRGARRPVLLAGTGVRLAGALGPFETVVERLGIPVTTAWTHDLIASDDPHFCGRQGTIGTRAGNFTVQNADLLLVVGARLTVRQVGYNWQAFAPRAFKVVVDVDEAEFRRPFVRIDLPIAADAGQFLAELTAALDADGYRCEQHAEWLAWCRRLVELYPPLRAEQRTSRPPINAYHFVERLFEHLAADDVVVCGNASATIVPFQAARLQRGQRLFSNSGSASMGYDLPAAVGAAVARRGRRVVCLAGDGSLQMNIQELATVRQHQLPVKLFVMDNRGYLSIRSTQQNFFGATIGSGPGGRRLVPGLRGGRGCLRHPEPCAWSSRARSTRSSQRSSRPRGRSCATSCWTRTRGSSRGCGRASCPTVRSFRPPWRTCTRSSIERSWLETCPR